MAGPETEIADRMRALLHRATWTAEDEPETVVARLEQMCEGILDLMVEGEELTILNSPALSDVHARAAALYKQVHQDHPAQLPEVRDRSRAEFVAGVVNHSAEVEENRRRLLGILDEAFPGDGVAPDAA